MAYKSWSDAMKARRAQKPKETKGAIADGAAAPAEAAAPKVTPPKP